MIVALDPNACSDFLRGVPVRVEIVRRAARIFLQPCQSGAGVPTNDLWIAALAPQLGVPLCSSDAYFQRVAGLILC
jgi:predicted nucleic acid-binding protein